MDAIFALTILIKNMVWFCVDTRLFGQLTNSNIDPRIHDTNNPDV